MDSMRKIFCFFLLLSLCSCLKEEALPVVVDFDYEVVNDDYSVPVSIVFFNRTQGADEYEWRFEGGNLTRSIDRNPGVITFNEQGVYTISLSATNIDGSEDIKEIEIQIDNPVNIDFEVTNLVDNFSPAKYSIQNLSEGATTFLWTFEGGIPESSTDQNPAEVTFTTPGEHLITLEVSNGRETLTKSTTIEVAPLLTADFTYTIAFEDDDFQIPAKVSFVNNATSATQYNWEIEGGDISSSSDENIEVIFNEIGEQNITLTTSNGKATKSITKTISFFENTNLRTIEDIKLGINTAHKNNTVGSFFSIPTRQVYTKAQVTAETAPLIDLVFYGLNSTYERNQFLSPDDLSGTPFDVIANAKKTVVINTQELCNCSVQLTAAQFDNIQDDTGLKSLNISADDDLFFNDDVESRIVLFRTEEGKKGAIKIKEFINNGDDSYIIVDIKVQKENTAL